jgi:hypothetical protein
MCVGWGITDGAAAFPESTGRNASGGALVDDSLVRNADRDRTFALLAAFACTKIGVLDNGLGRHILMGVPSLTQDGYMQTASGVISMGLFLLIIRCVGVRGRPVRRNVCIATVLGLWVLAGGCIDRAAAQEGVLRFPVYRIDIDPVHLEALSNDPFADDYYPATFTTEGFVLPCEIRYRGATSRNLPKKSWKIKFEGYVDALGAEEINLNAEYRDKSLMRNYLANRLYAYFGHPAPMVSYVNLQVNGAHMGLFLRVEQIDEWFLERNGKRPGQVYKGVNHGANMAPLAYDRHYPLTWEQKGGTKGNYNDLRLLLSRLRYWKEEDFNREIEQIVDVNGVLLHYAILWVISSNDNYCKNT